jgi:TDG/mug DNA glycosylase family protein
MILSFAALNGRKVGVLRMVLRRPRGDVSLARARYMNVMDADILPDLLAENLDLVICGTAAGAVSAARGAYYAGPGNRFWPMLAETGLTPRRFRPDEFPQLLALGIGLTDVCKTQSGQDEHLPRAGFDRRRLRAAIAHFRPRLVAFNSKRAASEFFGMSTGRLSYGAQPPVADLPETWVLPSTSGLACRAWNPAPWHAMAARARALRVLALRVSRG